MRVIKRRVYRMGVQTLEKEDDKYFIALKNRTYSSRYEVTEAKALVWLRHMEG